MNNHNITAGTPRGFNLSTSMPIMNGFPPNFSPQNNFPPFPNFGNHTVQAPGWPLNSPIVPSSDEGHQTGPMRRGGARLNTRPGPYDRRQQPRYTNDGRLTPMAPVNPMRIRGGFLGGAGKWGDGGAQTVGPREAVQGSTIMKYDDLDAAEGGGGAELNY